MMARACRRCGQNFHPSRDYHLCCWDCYGAAHGDSIHAASHAHAITFDAAEIRWILQCVHPDKHANSLTANQVTVKLLQMRSGAQ